MTDTSPIRRRTARALAVVVVGTAALAIPATTASASPCASGNLRDCVYQVKPPIKVIPWPDCPMCGFRFDWREIITSPVINPVIDKGTIGPQKAFAR